MGLPQPYALRAPANHGTPGVRDLSRRDSDSNSADLRSRQVEAAVPGETKQAGPYWAALRSRILQGDQVNEIKLAEIALDHDARTTSNAYFLAGVTEMQGGDAAKASIYFENALRVAPEQTNLLEWHAIALSAQGRYPEAVSELERATALDTNSAHLFQLLGLARYDSDRTGDAVTAWKRAMESSPDPYTERLLHKAEREREVEERSRRKQSTHFILIIRETRRPPNYSSNSWRQWRTVSRFDQSAWIRADRKHHCHSLHAKRIC